MPGRACSGKAILMSSHRSTIWPDCSRLGATTLRPIVFFAVRSKEKSPEAIERFTTESARLFGVMEKRLSHVPYLAGEDYSIADIACYGWTFAAATMLKRAAPGAWGDNPSIERWLKAVGERPAVQRGMAIPKVETPA